MKRGIDISFVQYGRGRYDLAQLKASGKADWVTARATYGSNPADDDGDAFTSAHDNCKLFGLPFGAYHFFLFGQDATTQAEHFLQQIDGRYGEISPMTDVEEGSGSLSSLQEMIERLATFNALVEKAAGKPLIYTNFDTWQNAMQNTDAFAGHGLWLAQSEDPRKSGLFGGWSTWRVWQFGTGSVPGIIGDVDLDELNGDDLGIISR